MTAAVILAGGTGERFAVPGCPKQFLEIKGKPLIEYVFTAFDDCDDIDIIIIVAAEEWRDKIKKPGKFRCFAKPGIMRQGSVYNGLSAISGISPDIDIVVIHDAARPFVTASDIRACVEAVTGYDGAMPVLPVKETVYKSIGGNRITALLNRDELFIGQTPEAYVYGKYVSAHKNLDLEIIRGSSEAAFLAGMDIRLFPGNPLNIKITTAEDLRYMRYIMGAGD